MKKNLLLLTNSYPYSNGETFLENEIEHLSKNFYNIHIISSNASELHREVPSNVTFQSLTIWHSFTKLSKLKKLFLILQFIFKIPLSVLFSKELYSRHWKYYFDELIIQLLKMKELKNLDLNSYALIYDYWLTNSSFAILLLKPKCPVIARAHHYDLYDKIYYPSRPPFITHLFNYLTCVFPISKHGQNYILNKKFNSKNVIISKLGVIDHFKQFTKPLNSSKKVIVSCSRIAAVKRVNLLAKAINQINSIDVEWHHFGDGPLFEEVKAICQNQLNKKVFLHGNVNNREIHNFYNRLHVDLFVSTSASEGIPVSMMEAICYGIPILSYNVGGVSEVVNEITGGFFDLTKTNSDHIQQEIESHLQKSFDRKKIREYYLSNFNAKKNYSIFTSQLNEFIN